MRFLLLRNDDILKSKVDSFTQTNQSVMSAKRKKLFTASKMKLIAIHNSRRVRVFSHERTSKLAHAAGDGVSVLPWAIISTGKHHQ